jgi:hypothetical protein
MLFMAERVAEFAAISSRELPPLCAMAYVLDSAKAVASVIIEIFIVSSSLWSVNDSNHRSGFGSGPRLPREAAPRRTGASATSPTALPCESGRSVEAA